MEIIDDEVVWEVVEDDVVNRKIVCATERDLVDCEMKVQGTGKVMV